MAAPVAGASTAAPSEVRSFASVADAARRTGKRWTIPTEPSKVTIITDSGLAGIRSHRQTHRLVGTQWDVRMQSCRRLVHPSCTFNRTRSAPTVLEEINAIAAFGGAGPDHVLIVGTGHNDWDIRLRSDLALIMAAARSAGFRKVAWTLYRDHVDPGLPALSRSLFARYARMNAILREEAASGRWPDLVLLDYGGFTEPHDHWFTADGIHLTLTGAMELADWLSAVIRYQQTPALRP